MKNILIVLLLILSAGVHGQTIQRVHQNNGTILQIPINTIDSITYLFGAQSQTTMRIHQSNGTVLQIPISTIDSITYINSNPGNLASLTTLVIGSITANNATSGGSISTDGGSPITHRGICWSTSPNPTTANNTAFSGSGTGTFTSNLFGLSPNTTYYVRAYAINSAGTAYGNQVSFTTIPGIVGISSHSCGAKNVHNPIIAYGSMTDQEGNVYRTVQIGSQTWMAENLKTTKYRNGTAIPNITSNTLWQNNTTGAYCSYNNNTSNDCPFGKLYNWYAVNNANQLCPTGWHVPRISEWVTLSDFLYPNLDGDNVTLFAGAMIKSTSTEFWFSPNTEGNNSSGFSGLPAGMRYNTSSFSGLGSGADWWSSTSSTTENAQTSYVGSTAGALFRGSYLKIGGLSVRCIKDANITPSATISSLNCLAATNNGNLIKGVAASAVNSVVPYTVGNGQTYETQTINSTGVTGLIATLASGRLENGAGTLTYTITGTPNSSGTASFALSFGGQTCTLTRTVNADPPTNPGSVADASGNTYPTVLIGYQVWMAENLRTTKYSDGSNITVVSDSVKWANNFNNGNQLEQPMMCWYNNDRTTYTANKFGGLYNWFAINPSTNGNKNVCPTGWHVPTDEEWNVLIGYLDPSYDPNPTGSTTQSTIAGGKMKSTGTQYWDWQNNDASNSSGFSGLPGGLRGGKGEFLGSGNSGTWWSSTDIYSGSGVAYFRQLFTGDGSVKRSRSVKSTGYSVRCIKN
jgi:uncharacterized protein (TIGR02145 family)